MLVDLKKNAKKKEMRHTCVYDRKAGSLARATIQRWQRISRIPSIGRLGLRQFDGQDYVRN